MRTHVCDVLVIGSGAGGLATAVTARYHGLDVLVVEKADVFGGTTARSGGWSWIPCNPLAMREGVSDSLDKARTYLQHETGNHFDAARIDAFLENGPRMVDFFERNTALKFVLGPAFSDYHPDAPGGMPGGRPIVAEPFDGRQLGKDIARLRPPLQEITFLGMMIGSGKELLHFFNVTRSVKSAAYVGVLFTKYLRDLALHGRAMRLTNGNALIGRLAKSAFDLGVPIWTSAPARELVESDGGVVGAVVVRDGEPVRVEARRGVVLASGGFPQDVARRKALFGHAPTGKEHWSPAPETNTGDGLRLGESAGGSLIEGYPNPAAWVPVSLVPRRDGSKGPFPHFIDRGKPGVIAVTRKGTRFTNEANSYHDFVQAMLRATAGEAERCAFLIVDHPTLRRYGLGFVKPFPVPIGPNLRSGYLLRGRTLGELAQKAGIDIASFEATVREYNSHAAAGNDPQFNRGGNAYNRYLGDPDHKPNPCVGPIATGPFYAIKVVPGDLGTFAGLRTNADNQVIDAGGRPIPGLFAAGNDAASIMGGNYPGGGITLGPALTFGYVVGRRLAGVDTAA
ncbi:FAD-dependent oxidoreductase [Ollibium composti]|uniref:FAD-dependent oxidoreductase n=1 Tax=Ollibium composti TaxID=2675109 RepID=A0ABY2Q345_9HYPH|nr:FAD-dependent oxidoreductase [Mesorhizobium composti]THF55350.1 FAD-dependent oxidoreductase [Mesorhizobium composti]